MKFKKLIAALSVVTLTLVSAGSASAVTHGGSKVTSGDHKQKISAVDAISAYGVAVANFTSATAALASNPNDKQLKKAVKKSSKQMKSAYRTAKKAIAREFKSAVKDAKKAYRNSVKGNRGKAEIVTAAQAVLDAAISAATTLRDSLTTQLNGLKPANQ